jgi:hypothetical protein
MVELSELLNLFSGFAASLTRRGFLPSPTGLRPTAKVSRRYAATRLGIKGCVNFYIEEPPVVPKS